jgi:hypothetical protein
MLRVNEEQHVDSQQEKRNDNYGPVQVSFIYARNTSGKTATSLEHAGSVALRPLAGSGEMSLQLLWQLKSHRGLSAT